MVWCGPPKLLLCFTLIALCAPVMGRLAVMSIDLGGEFMKIALVKPGVPMEIVLDKESSRKTRSIVAFRDGERTFANEAYNTAVRFPTKAFWFLTHIIGRTYDDPLVTQFRKRFPFYDEVLVKDEERGTILFKENDDTLYSAEELLGMMLEKAREYAQDFAEQDIKDAVITVPTYYNQAERRAVLTAAELVGINVLQLMTDNSAVALNYGVFRRKNFNATAQYYMFYDMGATSTTASIVSYQMVKTKEGTRVETNPQLTVKGVGYDRHLGGLEMTLRLRDHLAKVFNSKKKRSIKVEDNHRAMAKLLKEAERVKKVLSANSEHKAQVEGLVEGEDFAAKVTRDEYLELVKDLLDRVTKPMEDALKASEITMPEISEIILMGGGSRLPKVQELLLAYSGKSDLGKSINTDEAAALGAVYQAAFLGKGFKVKTFHVRDANLFPINVEFEKQKTAEDAGTPSRVIKRTLFGRMNPYPQKKVMTFNKHYQDFSFAVRYGDLDFLSEEEKKAFHTTLLSNVSLQGVDTALSKHKQEEAEYKGVKAHFRMDESGILRLDKVESVFEKQQAVEEKEDESTWSKIGSAFGGLFGGKEGEAEEGKTETPEEGAAPPQHAETNQTETRSDQSGQNQTGTDRSEQDQGSSDKAKEEKKEKPKKKGTESTEEKAEEEPSEKKEDAAEKKEEEEKPATEEKKSETDGEKKEGKEEKTDEKSKDKKDKKSKEGEEKKQPEKPAAPKVVTLKEDIKADVEVKDMMQLPKQKMKEAKQRLATLAKKDQQKVALEKAKNELEGYIFDSQDKLSQETHEACSTEEERTSILQQMSEASDWLYEQPDDAKKEVYIEKLKELKELMKNVNLRVFEREERPKALAALKQHINHTTVFLETVRNMTDEEDPIFTKVELDTMDKLINETTAWRDQAVKEQSKIPDHKNPTLLVEAIGAKIYALEREMKYLINKAKNYRPKPKMKKEDTTTKGNTTDSDNSKTPNETKTEEATQPAGKDEENEATVEIEDEATTTTPESQETAPETESKDEKPEETVEKPSTDTQSKTDKTSKKKRPKKKREQEETNAETLEIVREERSTYHPRNIDRDL
ncbi:hypoxia up-regulated protein 1-like isoform X2 [Littorina saxatilis]|uniref:hypoxia up-regulated protein 1-like isoform X2 n=1 Tax=Littorina saxatilis TaxID=31220 RepID=UPI0038B61B18